MTSRTKLGSGAREPSLQSDGDDVTIHPRRVWNESPDQILLIILMRKFLIRLGNPALARGPHTKSRQDLILPQLGKRSSVLKEGERRASCRTCIVDIL